MFVKCIYAEESLGALELNKVYKVVDEDDFCFMLDVNTNYWNKARFEIQHSLNAIIEENV